MLPSETLHPCYGKSALFDSTEANDHYEARALCATCPMIDACRDLLAKAKKSSVAGGRPIGTWAGELMRTNPKPRPEDLAEQNAAFTELEARLCHNAFNGGARDEHTVIGNRVYERRARARRKAAA